MGFTVECDAELLSAFRDSLVNCQIVGVALGRASLCQLCVGRPCMRRVGSRERHRRRDGHGRP
jgi:hypothetical protein